MGLGVGLASLLTSPCEAEARSRQDRTRVPAQCTHISGLCSSDMAHECQGPCHRDPSLGAEPVPPPTSWEPSLLPFEGCFTSSPSMGWEEIVEEAGSLGDPTEVEHHSDLRRLQDSPCFPGRRGRLPLGSDWRSVWGRCGRRGWGRGEGPGPGEQRECEEESGWSWYTPRKWS